MWGSNYLRNLFWILIVIWPSIWTYAKESACPRHFDRIAVAQKNGSGATKTPGWKHFDDSVKGIFDKAGSVGNKTSKYLLDLVKTRGLRLILKNEEQLPEFVKVYTAPKTFWGKIKSNINPFQYAFRKYTRWASGTEQTFHPIQLLDWSLVDLPTSMILKNKSVTIPGRIILGIPAAIYIWPKVQEVIDEERHAMIRSNVEKNKDAYNKKLAYSYLYKDVYDLMDSKEIAFDSKMARLAAYNLHQGATETAPRSLAAVMNFVMNTYPTAPQEDRIAFAMSHPFFSDIQDLLMSGVSTKGFLGTPVQEEASISTALPLIIEAKKDYLIGASLIESLAESGEKKWIEDESLKNLLSYKNSNGETQEDPFYIVVKKLVNKNDIDLDTARYLLEEDLAWQYEFEKRGHLGQTFAKVNEKGEFTSEPLLLKDIRKESLAERYSVKDRIKKLQ